jgi:hypothetical protein
MTRPPADERLLQQAVAFHRQGQFAAAAGLLRDLLVRQPRHFDAPHILALALANDPLRWGELRRRLDANRRTHPLLDNTLLARHLEAGYAMIRARLETGLPPDHLVIDRTAAA